MKSKIQKTLFAIGLSTSLALPIAPIALSLVSCSNVNQNSPVSQQDSSPIVNINHNDSTDNCKTTLIQSDKLLNTDYDLEMLKNDFNNYFAFYTPMTVTSVQLNQDDPVHCIDIKMNYYSKSDGKVPHTEHDTKTEEEKANIEIKHVLVKPIIYLKQIRTNEPRGESSIPEYDKQVCLGLSIPNKTSRDIYITHNKEQSFRLQINHDIIENMHHPQSGIFDHENNLESKGHLSGTYRCEWVPIPKETFDYCEFVKLSSPNIQKNFSYILEAQPDSTVSTPSN